MVEPELESSHSGSRICAIDSTSIDQYCGSDSELNALYGLAMNL